VQKKDSFFDHAEGLRINVETYEEEYQTLTSDPMDHFRRAKTTPSLETSSGKIRSRREHRKKRGILREISPFESKYLTPATFFNVSEPNFDLRLFSRFSFVAPITFQLVHRLWRKSFPPSWYSPVTYSKLTSTNAAAS
jgi:hypothetical protein